MIQTYYDAQNSALDGGHGQWVVLSLTSILSCVFISNNSGRWPREQLGILKALGYSNGQLAKNDFTLT